MTDARITAWHLLKAATNSSDEDLSRAAIGWAKVNGYTNASAPTRAVASGERSAVAGDGFTFRFGKAKGKTPHDVDVRDLRFYERCALEALDNPEKERWRESNQRDLDVIRAELRRRGEAGDW